MCVYVFIIDSQAPNWTDAATETTNGRGCETGRRRSRRRRRDARRAVNVVRVRARCVGVGLVYRAPVAADTKAARADRYVVLTRSGRYPGTRPSGEWGEGWKKLVLPPRDRLYRSSSSSSVSRCVRVSAVIVCVFSQPAACVLQSPPGDIATTFRRHFFNPDQGVPYQNWWGGGDQRRVWKWCTDYHYSL